LARALEHDKSGLLFQLACEHLRAEKIVRPGVTRLERLVMAAREGRLRVQPEVSDQCLKVASGDFLAK
jgi:hypothetical protein